MQQIMIIFLDNSNEIIINRNISRIRKIRAFVKEANTRWMIDKETQIESAVAHVEWIDESPTACKKRNNWVASNEWEIGQYNESR